LLEPGRGANVELVPVRVVLEERAVRVLALELFLPSIIIWVAAIRAHERGLAFRAQDGDVGERKRRAIFQGSIERAEDGVVLGFGATCHEAFDCGQDLNLTLIDKKGGDESAQVDDCDPDTTLIFLNDA
jgi:hypothetical protein